jgi:hypothetical protein
MNDKTQRLPLSSGDVNGYGYTGQCTENLPFHAAGNPTDTWHPAFGEPSADSHTSGVVWRCFFRPPDF